MGEPELSQMMQHFVNANSAALGGLLATTCTYPLDTINKKIINTTEGDNSTGAVVKKIMEKDGFIGFFPGLGSKLGWSFGGKFIFYGSYSILVQSYIKVMGHPLSFSHDLIAGYLSEWSTLPVALPFEAIATRLQSSKEGFFNACASVYADKGIMGFFKGLSAYPILCITPALTNTIFSQIKTLVLSRRDSKSGTLTSAEAFFYGAIARGIATLVMYPYLKAKTVLQSASKGGGEVRESATQVVVRTYKEKGVGALYDGLSTELARGVLSSAVTMLFKERIFAATRIAILSLAAKKAAVATAEAAS